MAILGFPTSISTYRAAARFVTRSYGEKYVRPGSFKPIVHLMFVLGVGGYLMEYKAVGHIHIDHDKHKTETALAYYKEHGPKHH